MSGVGLRTRTPPSVAPEPLAIDPRIAARWMSVQWDQHRRRRRTLLASLSGVTVLIVAALAARSPLLAVHDVAIRGSTRTPRAAVLLAGGLEGRPSMLEFDPGGVSRRIEALPWVAQAHVHRSWPTTVTIVVVERTPTAQISGTAGQPALIDDTGRVLAVGPEAAGVLKSRPMAPALPVLEGTSPAGEPGSSLAPEDQAALKVLPALGSLLADGHLGGPGYTVASIRRAGDGTVRATLSPGDVRVIFGSPDQISMKLVALRSVLAQLVAGTVATVDVRVPDAPVLTAGKNSSSVSTTQRG